MRVALLIALLALPSFAQRKGGRFDRFNSRCDQGRSDRGFACDDYAFFELAPANGTGMGTACSCAAITGARGEAVTWSRGSSAYCTTTGPATTALTPGTIISCGNNAPRVSNVSGTLMMLSETASTNVALRSEEFDNAAWTATAAVTPNTTNTPWSTLAADTLNDSDGIGIQGACQTFATSSAQRFSASVFVAAGTLAKASVRMTGTGDSTGDCVASSTSLAAAPSYTRLGCTSASAYLGAITAITICVEVGTVASDTGTIVASGAQLEQNTYVSSYIATTSAAASRAVETATSTMSLSAMVASGCAAATILPLSTTIDLTTLVGGSNARYLYLTAPNIRAFDSTNNPALSAGLVVGTAKRYRSTWSGATLTLFNTTDATSTSGAFDGSMTDDGTLRFAELGIAGIGPAYFGRLQLDPTSSRCQ